MVKKVSVIVSMTESKGIVDLVESLDLQSLPYAAYEVLFSVGEGHELGVRLEQLSLNRPNVVLPSRLAASELGRFHDAVSSATGEYVLPVTANQHLFEQSLQRLYDFAIEHQADVVVGRPQGVRVEGFNPDLVAVNRAKLGTDEVLPALQSPVRLIRRQLLLDATGALGEDADRLALDAELASRAGSVAVFADYPSVKQLAPADDVSASPIVHDFQVADASSDWANGRLRVRANGKLQVQGPDRVWIQAVLQHASGLEFVIAGVGSVTDSRFEVAVEIDVAEAALGERLPEGLWKLLLRPVGLGADTPADAAVPAAAAASALVAGTLFVVVDDPSGALILDVGATKHRIATGPGAEDASIVDNVRGALLRLQLPDVVVSGPASIAGHLALGKLKLPGKLISDGTVAHVECFVSGLAGSYAMSLYFGGVKTDTSLNLQFDEVGAISVVPRPAPIPKAKAKATVAARPPAKAQGATKPAAKPRAAAKPPHGAAKLRRRLPAGLEPLAKRLRRNPVARSVYRKLSGL